MGPYRLVVSYPFYAYGCPWLDNETGKSLADFGWWSFIIAMSPGVEFYLKDFD